MANNLSYEIFFKVKYTTVVFYSKKSETVKRHATNTLEQYQT